MTLRIRNPTPLQWTMVVGAGLFTLGIAGAAYAASRRKRGGGTLPDVDDEPVVEPPEEPEDWEEDEEDEEPEVLPESTEWRVVTPDDPGYPWPFPAFHFENYPTPGTWFNANDKSGAFNPAAGFDKLVQALLGSALAMAGNDYNIATAVGQDPNAELGRRLRRQVREAIMVVGGVNDLTYGQTNLNLAGGNDPNSPGGDPSKPVMAAYVLNEEGRGLNWLPRHADNVDRIQSGRALKRTTNLRGQKLSPPNSGSRQMLIWMPAFDLTGLGPDQAVPTIRFLQWADGSSTLHPPPVIQALGVDLSGVNLPGA